MRQNIEPENLEIGFGSNFDNILAHSEDGKETKVLGGIFSPLWGLLSG